MAQPATATSAADAASAIPPTSASRSPSADVPSSVKDTATVELASGVPFISDTQLEDALADTDLSPAASDAIA